MLAYAGWLQRHQTEITWLLIGMVAGRYVRLPNIKKLAKWLTIFSVFALATVAFAQDTPTPTPTETATPTITPTPTITLTPTPVIDVYVDLVNSEGEIQAGRMDYVITAGDVAIITTQMMTVLVLMVMLVIQVRRL